MTSKKNMSVFVIALAVSLMIPRFLQAEEEFLIKEEFSKPKARRHMLVFSGGGYLGRNQLLAGYKDYKDNFSGHLEVRMGIAKSRKRPDIIIGLNYDYMPMILPDGIYGMSERIASLNLNAYYVFYAQRRINFFAGPGFGYYFDLLSMDTPASGKIEHQYSFIGFNLVLGGQYYINKSISLIPILKYHQIREPGSFGAKHLVLQVGCSYNFVELDWYKWRRDY